MSNETNIEVPYNPTPLLVSSEAVLRKRFGGPVRLSVLDTLREKYRNRVLRLKVEERPVGRRKL